MAKRDDGLFLLEVLIDKIVLAKSPCFTDKEFKTCVLISCSAMPPLELCDDDSGGCPQTGGSFVISFNNGKSCLFALQESEITAATSKFPVTVSAYKTLPCGCLPAKIALGEATIDLTKEFVQARNKYLADPNAVSCEALKDSFKLTADGETTGEIVMFLRISCFGKQIVTRFQGGSGPPNLGGAVESTIVDRSCNPPRDFQTAGNPCACSRGQGAHGGGGGGGGSTTCPAHGGGAVCPPARDPYNSMPCEDPDDPCYCTGPKTPAKQPMACRNTDQYCLHVPKGARVSLPFYQESEDQNNVKGSWDITKQISVNNSYVTATVQKLQMSKINITNENFDSQSRISFPVSQEYSINSLTSAPSMSTIRSKRHSVSFSNTVQYIWRKDSNQLVYSANTAHYATNFGEKETTVYMTMLDDFRRRRTSASQATASINKCFQASPLQSVTGSVICTPFRAEYSSSNTATYCSASRNSGSEVVFNPNVYFFGEKKKSSCKHKEGMGCSKHTIKVDSGTSLTRDVRNQTTSSERIGSVSKSVNIKEPDRCGKPSGCCMKPCPATIGTKGGDMYAAVSHIQIGPREPCPVHGKEPCQGPKCIANAANAEKVPVRVSTVNNPRRGVFELVIRRMTGAPLARNELMLEWTPPPVRSPCGAPCPTICGPPGPCRPVRCRTVCRTSCKPKSVKRKCRKPCRPKPCRVVPCSTGPCQPCKPCKPCYPPFPFKPNPCSPCSACASCSPCPPCKPKPCRPCSSCGPCKPCKPNLICPTPRTSIIFKPNFPCKPCKRRSSCSPCGPFPCGTPCYSCFYCSTSPACPPTTCDPCASCDPCDPCYSGPCSKPCKPRKPCGTAVPCRRSCCKRKPVCRPRLPPKCRPFKPCHPCKPSPCIPCPPRPCSNPCYHPCGRRRCKYTCLPKIKPHKKRISPCHNRIKSCPVVTCQSQPAPCASKCCAIPSCSTPRCFNSVCSTSCN